MNQVLVVNLAGGPGAAGIKPFDARVSGSENSGAFVVEFDGKCEWVRVFDGHFNIGCVNETGQRANGNFKRDNQTSDTKWDFKYCPYCGREICVLQLDVFRQQDGSKTSYLPDPLS